MGDKTIEIKKRTRDIIQVEINEKIEEIHIFYSFSLYKTYKKALNETNDYKEAFFITIHKMMAKEDKTSDIESITLEDVKNMEVKYLGNIAEHIINSSGFIDDLNKNEEFINSDCFKRVYLMNIQMEESFKAETLKRCDELKLVSRSIYNLTENINRPIKNVHSQVEMVGKVYSQYLNAQSKLGDVIAPNVKSLIGLSGEMGKIVSPLSSATRLALGGFSKDIGEMAISTKFLSNLGAGVAKQLHREIEPINTVMQSVLMNFQKSIPKVGLEIGLASETLKAHNLKFAKIISNISNTKEVLINSNIEGIRSVLLEAQVGSKLFESQLKGVKESLSLVAKFNYGDKLISFESLQKSLIHGIKPFIIDFNSVLLSRNNVIDSIKKKALSMNNFDWWLISSLPITVINEIYKNKESLVKDEVDIIICNYYRNNDFKELDNIIERWTLSPYFNRRIDIVRECVDIHKLGKYSPTVPTLVPIIEGIIREFMLGRYRVFSESFNPIYKTFKNKVDEMSNFISSYVINCIDKLYCRFNPTKPDEVSDFSRHKISHGLATNYASESNSLKVILFLDEIFEIISSIEEMDLVNIS